MMLRRDFSLALSSLALTSFATKAFSDPLRGPLFWVAQRGNARVFILGFSDAKDHSWFTASIQRAFQDSSQLWLETAPPMPPSGQDAASQRDAAELMQKLTHEEPGHTLFDALSPTVRKRTLAYAVELGVKKEALEPLRPWAAYYAINSAYWSKVKQHYQPVYVDEMLGGLAMSGGKSIHYEMPTGEAFARFMAGMSDKAQTQYIEWLLDFLDDRKKGKDDAFGWVTGNPGEPPTRSLIRMRTKMPDLYQVIQAQRNTWWAHKTDQLLAIDGTYFVAVGLLHVLGPDGIPSQLQRLRVVAPADLKENPVSHV